MMGAVPSGIVWSPELVRRVTVPAGMFIPTRTPRTIAPTGIAAEVPRSLLCTVSWVARRTSFAPFCAVIEIWALAGS
jgi:hypothetical protein